MNHPSTSAQGGSSRRTDTAFAAAAGAWERFWFTPADSRPLALVRIGAAAVGLALWWSYAADLETWFGPAGVLPVETVRQWRSPHGFSLFEFATTPTALKALFAATGASLGLLLVGMWTPVVGVVAALLWASLLHRGPMLAGPADDCLAILLWCLAIGPAGEHFSLDRLLRDRAGGPPPAPSTRAAIARGLLAVHGSVIAAAAAVSQLKGDAWWDGLAAWYLAAAPQSGLPWLVPALAASEYLTNLLTHGITAIEIASAAGPWWRPSRRLVARVGLVGWPLVGLLVGEPFWGLAMPLFGVPAALGEPAEVREPSEFGEPSDGHGPGAGRSMA